MTICSQIPIERKMGIVKAIFKKALGIGDREETINRREHDGYDFEGTHSDDDYYAERPDWRRPRQGRGMPGERPGPFGHAEVRREQQPGRGQVMPGPPVAFPFQNRPDLMQEMEGRRARLMAARAGMVGAGGRPYAGAINRQQRPGNHGGFQAGAGGPYNQNGLERPRRQRIMGRRRVPGIGRQNIIGAGRVPGIVRQDIYLGDMGRGRQPYGGQPYHAPYQENQEDPDEPDPNRIFPPTQYATQIVLPAPGVEEAATKSKAAAAAASPKGQPKAGKSERYVSIPFKHPNEKD